MTVLIATLTADFALLSTDTYVSRGGAFGAGAAISPDFDAVAATTFDTGENAEAPQLLWMDLKLIELPKLRAAAAGAGSYLVHLAWRDTLDRLEGIADVIELDRVAPELLTKVLSYARWESGKPLDYVAVTCGWDAGRGAPAGFAYSSEDGFRSVPLGIGHTVMPVPATDDPDYAAVYEAWEPAAQGIETERFHVMLADNAYRSCRRGLLRPGVGIGGELHTARIDRHGLTVCLAHRFPAEDQL